MIKILRFMWLGRNCGMKAQGTCRKLTFHKPEGTRRVGRPAKERLDSGEEGLKEWALEIAGEI